MRVWKYEYYLTQEPVVFLMPASGKFLSWVLIPSAAGRPDLDRVSIYFEIPIRHAIPNWSEVGVSRREHKFQIFGTGQDIPESAEYRGTIPVEHSRGLFGIWHLYELLS